MLPELAINQAPKPERVGFFQLVRQGCVGEVLVTKRTHEALDGASANRGGSAVSRGRVWPPMVHRMTHFDTCRETITDKSAGFGLKNVQQIAVNGKIFGCAMDCGCELTFQLFSCGKHLVF